MVKCNDWLWDARCTQWIFKITENKSGPIRIAPCMDPYFSGGISMEEVTRDAKAFKKAGINMVLTEVLRRLMLYEKENKTLQVIELIRMAADACHREGIKIIHHTTASFVGQDLNGLSEAQRDWLSIDAQTGNYAYLNMWGGWYLWCINNPDFRAEYFRLCKKIIKETGIDGFMVDEVYFRTGWYNCACRHCRGKYQKMTGHILPDAAAEYFWGNFKNPAFREWLNFRCVSVGDFYEDLHKALNEVHPHPILMGCKSADTFPYGTQQFGDSSEERSRGINALFAELSGSSTSLLYSWRFLAANLMVYTGLSGFYKTPTIVTMCHQAGERFFNWALRLAHGARTWATSSTPLGEALGPKSHLLNFPEDYNAYSELFAWEEKHKQELKGPFVPLANIGIFLGESTRDMLDHGSGRDYEKEFTGWSEFLTDEFIQYAVILESELTLSRLQDFSLIILPNTVCLSNTACQALLDYVKAGGSMILTHKSGERNNSGGKRIESLCLGSLLGIKLKSEELSAAVDFGSCGQGKWAYFAHKPGMAIYSTINQVNTTRNRDATDNIPSKERYLQKSLMLGAIQWALEKPMPLTVENAPNGILIKAFRKSDDNAVVIHILNCRGERAVNFGELIPPQYDVDFPKLEEDIVVELNLPLVKQAHLFSPDWDGIRPVGVRQVNDGAFTVTIPADTLHRYEVLYINLKA